MQRKLITAALVSLLMLGVQAAAFAHGVDINYQVKSAVEITAAFGTGEPLAGGQVTIYAPDNPSVPWSTGKCDENGHFTFTPDPSRKGTWNVQVYHAGHGGVIDIPVGEGAAASGAAWSTGYTPLQIILMAACVIWGLAGTALFFSRRKS